jgi:hypothetical protein
VATQAPPGVSSRWTSFRLALAVAWILLLPAAVLLGERATSMAAFDEAVSAGRVHTVRLDGGLPPGTSGSALVEVRWRDRLIARVAEVRQVSADQGSQSSSGESRTVVGDLPSQLSLAHPGLRVDSHPDEPYRSGLSGDVLGRHLWGWPALAPAALALAGLFLLINGPQPWRATRWAWFWIGFTPLLGGIGVLAFLVLSGPTPLVPAPRTSRRLRGGWAFVIMAIISTIVNAL